MKIFGYNIDIAKATNADKPMPNRRRSKDRVIYSQLLRQKQDVGQWRDALRQAESTLRPDRTELIRIFKDVELDAHFCSTLNTIHNTITSSRFYVAVNGERDDELSKMLDSLWFRKWLTYCIDSKVFGYSLVELGPMVNNNFDEIKLVPREYVVPEKHFVKKSLYNWNVGFDYESPKFRDWFIGVGDHCDMGLINKVTPWALWKKNTAQSWSQYSELFGMPIRVGKTDIRDPDKRENMDNMLKNMGRAAFATLDEDDMIEFIENSGTDAYQVYQNLLDTANKEISKVMLGQTMTSEDGSSRSQAEVHEGVMETYMSAYKFYCKNRTQRLLVPRMQKFGALPQGATIEMDNSEQLSSMEKFTIYQGMLNHYNIPAEHIQETFGIEVEEKEVPPALEGFQSSPEENIQNVNASTTVMREVYNLYKGAQDDNCC